VADETRLRLALCHVPPGTSTGNKRAPRLVAYITQHGRGRPLTSHEVIVNRSGNTTTQTGRHIHAELDTNPYATGKRITAAELAAVPIERDSFHGEWNYTIVPRGLGK
jgi:hypothetical protein